MKRTTKYIIGGTVGGAIGYFVGSVIVEMILYKAQLADMETTEYEKTDEFPQESVDITTPKKLEVEAPGKKNYTKHFAQEERPDLEELRKKYQAPIEDRQNTDQEEHMTMDEEKFENSIEEVGYREEDWSEDIVDDTDHEPIMIISVDEYAADDSMTHITLRYYEDDIVTDENNQPIDRPEKFLGEDALVSFGQLSQDEDIVYVRNLEKKCMYEVVRMNKEYLEMTEMTEVEARRIIKKRRAALNKLED